MESSSGSPEATAGRFHYTYISVKGLRNFTTEKYCIYSQHPDTQKELEVYSGLEDAFQHLLGRGVFPSTTLNELHPVFNYVNVMICFKVIDHQCCVIVFLLIIN